MIRVALRDPEGVTLDAKYDHDGFDLEGDILIGLEGWVSGVGVESSRVPRSSGHGDFPAPTRRTGRTLTLSIHAERETRADIWAFERAVSGLYSNGGTGRLEVDIDGFTLASLVDLDGEPKIETNIEGLWCDVEIPLHAADPTLLADERVFFARPVESGIGLTFPLFSPYGVLSFGQALEQDVRVTNDGNATAYPTHIVVGDFPGGFRLTVNRRSVEWPWPTVKTAPVRIESSGAIWIGDQNVTHRASVREWSSIPPGGTIVPSLAALQGGDGWCETHHRDTYI